MIDKLPVENHSYEIYSKLPYRLVRAHLCDFRKEAICICVDLLSVFNYLQSGNSFNPNELGSPPDSLYIKILKCYK